MCLAENGVGLSGRAKVLLGFGVLVLTAGITSLTTRPPSPRETLRDLRVELRALKDSAEACSDELTAEQARFMRYEARVDSMRRRIAALESILPEGVPGDSYPAYLAAVDSFNRALPDWEPATDSLAATRLACQQRIDAHAALADSVRLLAESLGLLDLSPDSGR